MSSAKAARNKHLNESFRKLDITKDEFGRISEAMKKEEFRQLLIDYVEEIQDPENRERYESEIIQLEAERGVEVKFVNPEPGFVIKTSVDGQIKCFINVAKNSEVAPPSHEMHTDPDSGCRGLNWSLPLAQTSPREDVDANGKLCMVYDVIFHPDTVRMAECNKMFRKCLIDTTLDAVERAYEVKLDRTNLKFPKISFKGIARATVIRKLSQNPPPEDNEPDPLEHMYPKKPTVDSAKPKKLPMKDGITKQPEFTTPIYNIKHRRGFDYTECTYELDAKLNATLPRELVVEIELPLLKSTAECQLDVTASKIYLLSERPGAKYRLNLDLPYEVNDKEGNARFDTDTRRLEITLPIKQVTCEKQKEMHNTLLNLHREDSGVESDVREEILSNPRGSPVEDLNSGDSVIESDESPTVIPEPVNTADSFLNPNIAYKFPAKFDCNMLDNMMSLVLHVYNVQQESINILQKERSVQLSFASVGSGYFPTHYAFYFELPEATELKLEAANAEAWENNVVVNLTLAAITTATSPKVECKQYLAGLNNEDLTEYAVPGKFQINAKSLRGKSPCYVDVSVERLEGETENSVEVAIKPRPHTPPRNYKEENKNCMRKNSKNRSYSESACDDLNKVLNKQQVEECKTESNESGTLSRPIPTKNNLKHITNNNNNIMNNLKNLQQRKQRSYSECHSESLGSNNTLPPSFKGILKHRSSYDRRPSISDSCSSMDESFYGCSVDTGLSGCYSLPKNFNNCIPEEEAIDTPLSESCKKTVRFNDNIKKQVFRMDSSILGQRKKNQKCRIRKQRALQRRVSEGDSADYEDNNNNNNNNVNHIKENNKMQYLKEDSAEQNNKYKNKEKANKKSRPRLESESSSDVDNKNSMMFEMDM